MGQCCLIQYISLPSEKEKSYIQHLVGTLLWPQHWIRKVVYIYIYISFSLSLHWVYGSQPPSWSMSRYLSLSLFLPPLTPIFFRSFSTSAISFLAFQQIFFSFGILLKNFTLLSSGIISACPNHRRLPSLISEIMSGSLYRSINSWSMQILHMPFSFTGPRIFLNIFFSHIAKLYSSVA